jgi:hypothetical protein
MARRQLRKTAARESAKIKATQSSESLTQTPTKCYLQNMPNEVMGIIFGDMELQDLGRMLSTSKWIIVCPYLILR